MMLQNRNLYEFGTFRFDPSERLLLKDGQPVSLTPRGFEALNVLLASPGRLVTKQELMAEIWGDACVEPGNLAVTISLLRKALGDESGERKYIQTVSKLGYRFTADVRKITDNPAPPPAVAPPEAFLWRIVPPGAAMVLAGLALAVFFWMKGRPAEPPVRTARATLAGAGFGFDLARSPMDRQRRAHELYLYGRYCWNRRNEDALRRSVDYFQEALAEDPGSALVYAGLADAYTSLSSRDLGRAAHPLARSAAVRAIALDASLPEAHAAFGFVLLIQDRDWKGAEREFQKAIALDPNCAIAHQRYGLALAAAGRLDESLEQLRSAAVAEPLSLIINTDVGWSLYLHRQYDEAIAAYRKVLNLDPNFDPAHTFLGLAYIQKGAYNDAIRELEESRRIARSGYAGGFLAYAQARAGDASAGRRALSLLTDASQHQRVPPFSLAVLCVGLGQKAQAIEWLEKSYQVRNSIAVYAKTDPSLDPLRTDPRFNRFLQRMGF